MAHFEMRLSKVKICFKKSIFEFQNVLKAANLTRIQNVVGWIEYVGGANKSSMSNYPITGYAAVQHNTICTSSDNLTDYAYNLQKWAMSKSEDGRKSITFDTFQCTSTLSTTLQEIFDNFLKTVSFLFSTVTTSNSECHLKLRIEFL